MATPDPLTITVTPKHILGDWMLVYEISKATGDVITVSIVTADQAAALPVETELSEYLVKKLGNVLAREAPGCFAKSDRATVTFDARTARVKTIA